MEDTRRNAMNFQTFLNQKKIYESIISELLEEF